MNPLRLLDDIVRYSAEATEEHVYASSYDDPGSRRWDQAKMRAKRAEERLEKAVEKLRAHLSK